MKKIELRIKEQIKYLTIKKLLETNGNKKSAAIRLDCGIRNIDRMIAGYKSKGKEFFIYGNRGKSHAYYDCNYAVFTEFLAERENIFVSIDEVRVLLRNRYILFPRSHKSTRKRLKKQLLKSNLKLKKRIYKLI